MPKNETTQILLLRRKEQELSRRIAERPISEPIPTELSRELEAVQNQIYELQRAHIEPIEVPVPEREVQVEAVPVDEDDEDTMAFVEEPAPVKKSKRKRGIKREPDVHNETDEGTGATDLGGGDTGKRPEEDKSSVGSSERSVVDAADIVE